METKKLRCASYVDLVLSADTINKFKPNPTGLVTIVNKFKVIRKRLRICWGHGC